MTCQAQSHSIHLRGMNFHYLSWGAPKNPPLLCLHGYLDQAHSFDDLAEILKSDFYVLAWDARGHGQTAWIHPSGYYHFFDYLYDLHCLIQALNLENLLLLGHSMGGMIASLYAGIYSENLRGLINLEGWGVPDTDPKTVPERVKRWLSEQANLEPLRPLADLAAAQARLQKHDPLLGADQARHLAETGTKKTAQGWIWRHDPLHRTRAPQPFYLAQGKAFWEKITCPTLLLYGTRSGFLDLPDWQERLRFFPQANVQAIENAGHNLHLHQAEALAQSIQNWLQLNVRI